MSDIERRRMYRSTCHLSGQIQTAIHHSRIVGNLVRNTTLNSGPAGHALARTGHSIRSLLCRLSGLEARSVGPPWNSPNPALHLLYRHNHCVPATAALVRLSDPPYHMTRSPTHFITSESAARSDRCAACLLYHCMSMHAGHLSSFHYPTFHFIILLIDLLRRRGPRCATKKN